VLQHVFFFGSELGEWALADEPAATAARATAAPRWSVFIKNLSAALLAHFEGKMTACWQRVLKEKRPLTYRTTELDLAFVMAQQSAAPAVACAPWRQLLGAIVPLPEGGVYAPLQPLGGALHELPFHFVLLSVVPQVLLLMEAAAARRNAAALLPALAAPDAAAGAGAGAGGGGGALPQADAAEQQKAAVRVGGALAHYFLNMRGRRADLRTQFEADELM